jgi:Tfp pilus assembly protein PilF
MSRMDQLNALLLEDPKDCFILFAIAKEYEKNGEDEKAISQYLDVLKIDEDYIGVYYHLANLYVELSEVDKAMETYDNGIAKAKKQADFHAMSELLNAKKNVEMENL